MSKEGVITITEPIFPQQCRSLSDIDGTTIAPLQMQNGMSLFLSSNVHGDNQLLTVRPQPVDSKRCFQEWTKLSVPGLHG